MTVQQLLGKKIAVNFQTEEEAVQFLQMCEDAGIIWFGSRNKVTCFDQFGKLGADTCFFLDNRSLHIADVTYAINYSFTIIPFADLAAYEENLEAGHYWVRFTTTSVFKIAEWDGNAWHRNGITIKTPEHIHPVNLDKYKP